MYRSIFPGTDQLLALYSTATDQEIRNILTQGREAYRDWSGASISDRIDVIRHIRSALELQSEQFAQTMTWEMGKPIAQSRGEMAKCLWLLDHAIESGESYFASESLNFNDISVVVRHDALGCILGVMPWNFPVWQTLRYAIPALMAGNVVINKPAPNVPRTSLSLAELIGNSTGLTGVYQNVLATNEQVARMIGSAEVAGVTLTGSERAGSAVAAIAGKHLKKTVLELGGSDPFIVLDDADVEAASTAFVASRMNNTGQTCIAAKRAIVSHSIERDFVDQVVYRTSKLKLGNPFNEDTDLGCIARTDLVESLQVQLESTVTNGAKVLLEGGRVDQTNYFNPAILSRLPSDSPALSQEVFGPVVSIVVAKSDDEAVALANHTSYGLGAGIWSNDQERALQIAARIDAGSIHINRIVGSDPRVPFGGVKASGYGRELGREGFLEFTNLKAITTDIDSGKTG